MVLIVLGILLLLGGGIGIGFGIMHDFSVVPETSFLSKMGDFSSVTIIIVAGILAAIGIAMLLIGLKTKPKVKTIQLVESALMIAIAVVLNELLKIRISATGGGLTLLSMLPIVIICHRYGTGWGLFTSFVFSLIQLVFGLKNIGYASDIVSAIGILFLDYIVAYTVIGLSAIFGKSRGGVAAGIIVSFTLRFISHLVCGAWIWGEWMPEEYFGMTMTNPWIYSALYNGWYMLAEIILTVLVVMLLYKPLAKYMRFPVSPEKPVKAEGAEAQAK